MTIDNTRNAATRYWELIGTLAQMARDGRWRQRRKRRPLTFTKRDVARAITGHMQAGLSVQRTEIDQSGRIVVVTGQPESNSVVPSTDNEWDEVR